MPVDGEDTTTSPAGSTADLDDDPTELDTGGQSPPSQPPEAALRCRYREVNTMTQICICLHVPSPDEPPLPSVILLEVRLVLLIAQFCWTRC